MDTTDDDKKSENKRRRLGRWHAYERHQRLLRIRYRRRPRFVGEDLLEDYAPSSLG